ncbi:MAG: hypothetical protein EXQ63_00585 [Ilumatobacteraceae bacterium]|nr:hypothetical protein [Ilumatobacteraceae bacterium]
MIVPMFPLGSVFLPGDQVPLRIFEPRYVEMMRQLLAGETQVDMSFACVLIGRGSEVGGADHRRDIGVMVHIEQCVVTPEGGYALVGLASDIVVVDEWLVDDPFPRARVQTRASLVIDHDSITHTRKRINDAAVAIEQILQGMHGPNMHGSESGRGYLDADLLSRITTENNSLIAALWHVTRHLPVGPDIRYDFLSCLTLNDLMAEVEIGITHTQEMLAFLRLERD